MIKRLLSRSFFLPGTTCLVLGLGINCTIGYGTLFYSFSLLSLEFEKEFSWSGEFIYGVYSLGIFMSGLASPFIGKALDKFGVRWPMTIGSLLITIILYSLSQVQGQWQFVVSLLFMEVISLLVLYESAFVALSHFGGQKARLPITQITLMAGFASTLFWPLTAWLIAVFDWRVTYQVMALMHFFICLPLHFLLLKKSNSPVEKTVQTSDALTIMRPTQKRVLWQMEVLVSLAFGCVAFCIAGVQLHLFSIMSSLHISEKMALLASVLVGPFQVFSRLTDILLGRLVTPTQLAMLSIWAMLLGALALLFSGFITVYAVLIFAILFGAGQGLSYIVRGAAPLFLFGAQNYGAITGRINGVRMLMTAVAPVSFAIIMSELGAIYVLCLVMLLMLLSILILQRVNVIKAQAEIQTEYADC